MELLEGEKIEEQFEYLEVYRNSLSEDGEIEDVEELIRYYRNNNLYEKVANDYLTITISSRLPHSYGKMGSYVVI